MPSKAFAGASLLAALGCMLVTARGETPDPQAQQSPTAVPIATDTFRDPKPKHFPRLEYPFKEVPNLDDGWVVVDTMVDSKGKPFEATVVRSTGNPVFEKLALRTVEQATFEPATVNGKPVDSDTEITYRVRMDGRITRASPRYVTAIKALEAAFKANDRAAADAAMSQLETNTLYEDAYYGVALYSYAIRWGNAADREAALARALGGQEYLTRSDLRSMVLANLGVQLEKRDYYQAMQMWDRLHKIGGLDKDKAAKLQPVIDEVAQLRTDSRSYEMSGTVEARGTWTVHLFKRHFHAAAPAGAISEVKLRCKRGFVSFAFNPAVDYNVPERLGDCTLSLEGTPGTALTFTQS